jgi:hypothetical protein
MAARKKSTIYAAMMARIARMGVAECEAYAQSEPAFATALVRRLQAERRQLIDAGIPKSEVDRISQAAWIRGIREHREAFAMDYYFRRCSPQLHGIRTRRENAAQRGMAA